jgi:CHAT domain-containing protein
LSFLPLHAAGVYGPENSESLLNYAVSSYIPTVSALTHIIKGDRRIDEAVSGLFLTDHPKAPGTSVIPGTSKEVLSIYAEAKDRGVRVCRVEGNHLTIGDCLNHMESFSSIHLACHASQDTSKPLQSRFLFHNGCLDLSTIMQRNLKNADLAFLSACQTGMGEENLSDEAVHLAAGMLAAGYRRVVATMWAIGDRHATDVAKDFYQYIYNRREDGDGSTFDGSLSAYALHHATRRLRQRLDNSEMSLLAWVPYVHFGY